MPCCDLNIAQHDLSEVIEANGAGSSRRKSAVGVGRPRLAEYDPSKAALVKVHIVPGERGEQTVPCIRLSELEVIAAPRDDSEVTVIARSFLQLVRTQDGAAGGYVRVCREELVSILENLIEVAEARTDPELKEGHEAKASDTTSPAKSVKLYKDP